MNFDFKITTWERVTVPEHLQEDVLGKIKSGEISSSNDLFDLYPEDASIQTVDEVEEQMTVEENNGGSTIEVLVDGKTIYGNGEF